MLDFQGKGTFKVKWISFREKLTVKSLKILKTGQTEVEFVVKDLSKFSQGISSCSSKIVFEMRST